MFLRKVTLVSRFDLPEKSSTVFYGNAKTFCSGFYVTSTSYNHMRVLRLHRDLELFIAGITAVQSLFMASFSFLGKRRDFKNLLLGLFFIAITIRIGKSMLWVYLDSSPLWFLNLGFAAHAISGPALFLYVRYTLFPSKWSKWSFLHFLPGAFLALFLTSLSLESFWHVGGYVALLWYQMGYSVGTLALISAYFLRTKHKTQLPRTTLIWIASLVLGTSVLQFFYFSNYILGITPYLLGPISYLPFVCFLAFLLFKNPSILYGDITKKHQNIKLSLLELNQMAEKIKFSMENQKLFLDSNCSLAKVAEATKIPPYLVSYVVNNSMRLSFPDFLNNYRIAEAKSRLLLPEYRHTKVASIAYDCGFHSISSFNQAFKKMTGTTPSQFQKKHISA